MVWLLLIAAFSTPPAEALTRESALLLAIAGPEHAAALARVEQARARLGAAEVLLVDNPEIEGSWTSDRLFEDTGKEEWEVGLRQRVELSGARGARIRAAQAELAAAEAEVEAVEYEVRGQVLHAFQVAVHQNERAALLAEAAQAAAQGVALAERRLRAGDIAEAELSLLRADAAGAAAEGALAQADEQAARIELARLIGRPVPALAPSPWPGALPPPPLPELLRQARSRPERVAAEHILEAREAQVGVQQRERWPAPELGLAYMHSREGQGAHDPGPSHQLALHLALPLPLFRSGFAEMAEAQGRVKEARAQHAALIQASEARVQTAHARFLAAHARLAPYEALDESLTTTLKRYTEAHARGRLATTELLAVQERVRRARLGALEARHALALAAIELEQAVGAPLAPGVDR